MKNRKLKALLLVAATCMLAQSSQAAFSTNITNIATDASAFFDVIVPIVIGVVTFGVGLSYVKLLKRK